MASQERRRTYDEIAGQVEDVELGRKVPWHNQSLAEVLAVVLAAAFRRNLESMLEE